MGSVFFMEVPSQDKIAAFLADEPYKAAGLYEKTDIHRWTMGGHEILTLAVHQSTISTYQVILAVNTWVREGTPILRCHFVMLFFLRLCLSVVTSGRHPNNYPKGDFINKIGKVINDV